MAWEGALLACAGPAWPDRGPPLDWEGAPFCVVCKGAPLHWEGAPLGVACMGARIILEHF